MDSRRKTLLITTIIIVLFLIIGAVVFYFLLQKENKPEVPGQVFPGGGSVFPGNGQNATSTEGGQPIQGSGNQIIGGTGLNTTGFQPVLRMVSKNPVAGGITVDRDKAYTRFVERSFGNTYETAAENILPIRLTNTKVPQVYNAFFNKTGDIALVQYLKNGEIQTFAGNVIPKGGGEGELRGQFLSPGISTIALSPLTTRAFYMTSSASGSTGGIITLSSKARSTIFENPLGEWLVSWPKESTVTLNSKAGYNTEGVMMFLDAVSGQTSVILSGIKGLTTLTSSDADRVLYSRSTDSGFQTLVWSISAKQAIPLSLSTLPEKCVWSKLDKAVLYCSVPESLPSGNYPDDWYQGTVSFRDEVWKINTQTGDQEYLMNLSSAAHKDLDAFNPSLDDKERFITFMNKDDLSLWTLQIAR